MLNGGGIVENGIAKLGLSPTIDERWSVLGAFCCLLHFLTPWNSSFTAFTFEI